MLKRLAGFFLLLIAAGFLIHFYQSRFEPSLRFHPGEKVRVTRSSEHALAVRDGGQRFAAAAGWWKYSVVKNEDDDWVKLQDQSSGLIRYAPQSELSRGWITASQYGTRHNQINQ